jgi:hypothetical protein
MIKNIEKFPFVQEPIITKDELILFERKIADQW